RADSDTPARSSCGPAQDSTSRRRRSFDRSVMASKSKTCFWWIQRKIWAPWKGLSSSAWAISSGVRSVSRIRVVGPVNVKEVILQRFVEPRSINLLQAQRRLEGRKLGHDDAGDPDSVPHAVIAAQRSGEDLSRVVEALGHYHMPFGPLDHHAPPRTVPRPHLEGGRGRGGIVVDQPHV